MASTFALIKKEQPKKPDESELQYADRVEEDTFWKLYHKKNRSKDEETEYKKLERRVTGNYALKNADFPAHFSDEDIKPTVERVHRELIAQFGDDTPQKRMLTQRLACAWNQAWSYERMFGTTKYKKAENGGYSFEYGADRTRYLAELRKGMESANDQIIRLTQALQNLVSPPIQVKAKNAIIAQNMQINQGTSAPKIHAEAPR